MKILVIGGTGSFGHAFVERYQKYSKYELTVFSRDETKQHEMRLEYPNVRYEIGDIRDRQRVGEVMRGQDYIFHAAALKQVPSCEFFPMEAVKTNILGASHILDNIKPHQKIVCLSTDKAVYPINAMGISKAMMERIAISKGAIVTRYGNVMRSRGSIIPIWEEQARQGNPLSITNPKMTRFLLSLEDSIDLVMYALENGNPGEIFVKKAPACTMWTLAEAISPHTRIVGTRHGEKTHETLISEEEMHRTEDMGDYFRVKPDSRDMNYDKFFTDGQEEREVEPYTSKNTDRLNTEQVREVLNGLEETRS